MRARAHARVFLGAVARVAAALALLLAAAPGAGAVAFGDTVQAACAADAACAARWLAAPETTVAFRARWDHLTVTETAAWAAAHAAPTNASVLAAVVAGLSARDLCGDSEAFDDALGACACVPGRDCALDCGHGLFFDLRALSILVALLLAVVAVFGIAGVRAAAAPHRVAPAWK